MGCYPTRSLPELDTTTVPVRLQHGFCATQAFTHLFGPDFAAILHAKEFPSQVRNALVAADFFQLYRLIMTLNLEPKAVRPAKTLSGCARIKGLTSVLAGILSSALLQNSVQASMPLSPPYSLTLAWNPSASAEITGYNVYYGTTSGIYPDIISVETVTAATVPGLSSGVTYYFAVTAVNVDGVESSFSNEISYRQPLPGSQIQTRGISGGQFTLTVTGPVGQTYDLEATQDFTTWAVIGTGTIDANGSLSFTDPEAGNFQQRFYRTRETQP